MSHTVRILADVLAAGPHAERPKYDPFAATTGREGDVELIDVGKGAQMPWDTDGHRWHTEERVTTTGKPCRWEGRVIDWVEEQIRAQGEFGDTIWNQRTIVEVPATKKTLGWFLHAMTGQEWVLRLVFRVGKNTFRQEELAARLNIPSLNDTPGLEVYGDNERVQVANRKGPWQEVAIVVHRLSEIDTPGFRSFLKQAVAAFHANLKRLQTKPEDVMPWKVNGERWHRGEKGFPAGKQLRWERGLLPRLLDLMREVEPKLAIDWTVRAAITLRVPGIKRAWAIWRTKDSHALDCRFLGKKGQLNLSRVEGLGASPSINSKRSDGDVLHLQFQHAEHLHAARLKELLTEHLKGFRVTFGN